MDQPTQVPGRHALLPGHLTAAELANWLQGSSVERFTDEYKRIFEPEEISEFEHESSANGREVNRLMDLLEDAKLHVMKGAEGPLVISLPATAGKKKLDSFRRQNDDFVERGYEMIETEIFGIPSAETGTMEFFDIEGRHIEERSRPLSAKEKHTHLGMFQKGKGGSKMFIPKGYKNFDTDTGEVEDERDGTNG